MQSIRESLKPSEKANDNQCFVCKRTEDDVKRFLISTLENSLKKYDDQIKEIKLKLLDIENRTKSDLDNILGSTDTAKLDWKTSTVCDDIELFKDDIPCVEDLINYGKKPWQFKLGQGKHRSLLDIRNDIERIRKEIDCTKMYEIKNYTDQSFHNDRYAVSAFVLTPLWETLLNRDDLTDLLNSLQDLTSKSNTSKSRLDMQKKNIAQTQHRQLTRQIRTKIKYPGYEVISNQYTGSFDKAPDVIETPYSIHVCTICYSLVQHNTWADVESEFEVNEPPPLNEDETLGEIIEDEGFL